MICLGIYQAIKNNKKNLTDLTNTYSHEYSFWFQCTWHLWCEVPFREVMQVILHLENNQPINASSCRNHLKFLSSAHLMGRNDAKTVQNVVLRKWKFPFSNNPFWSVLPLASAVLYHKRSIPCLAVVHCILMSSGTKYQLKSLWKTLSLVDIWVLIWNVIRFFEWPGNFKQVLSKGMSYLIQALSHFPC